MTEPIRPIMKDQVRELIIDAHNAGEQKGRKQVVDWINQNHKPIMDGWAGKNKVIGLDIDPEKWQAQLKKWGIEKEVNHQQDEY